MKKILVIDDNQDAADMLSALLEYDGHVIATAYGGHDGLALAMRFAPDIVFLDIGMPELNGYEVSNYIRQLPLARQPCLIAFTAWDDPESIEKMKRAGFNQSLTKASTLEALRSVVKGVSLRDEASWRRVTEWLGEP